MASLLIAVVGKLLYDEHKEHKMRKVQRAAKSTTSEMQHASDFESPLYSMPNIAVTSESSPDYLPHNSESAPPAYREKVAMHQLKRSESVASMRSEDDEEHLIPPAIPQKSAARFL